MIAVILMERLLKHHLHRLDCGGKDSVTSNASDAGQHLYEPCLVDFAKPRLRSF